MTDNKITLSEIKSGIYKALDEYSRNGIESGTSDFGKADNELRMLSAINSSLLRVSLSLPMYSKEARLFFFSPKVLLFKDGFALSGNDGRSVEFSFSDALYRCAVSFSLVGRCSFKVYGSDKTECFDSGIIGKVGGITEYSAFLPESVSFSGIEFFRTEGEPFRVSCFAVYDSSGLDLNDTECIPAYSKSKAKLPEDFGEVNGLEFDGRHIREGEYEISHGFIGIKGSKEGAARLVYTPKLPYFDEKTSDDAVLEIPDVTSYALIYLAASELCSVDEGELYSRLIYKYQDIALNSYGRGKNGGTRNSFYAESTKRNFSGGRKWDM